MAAKVQSDSFKLRPCGDKDKINNNNIIVRVPQSVNTRKDL